MVRKILFTLLAGFMLSSTQAQETNRDTGQAGKPAPHVEQAFQPAHPSSTPQPLVYIIPIKKMIEPALLYVVRRGVDEAVRNDADAIVLQMDTTGGRVDSAVAIVGALGHSEIPVYTFVEKEAISAGAMIALSTSAIYMKQGSIIGDITPISMGMSGGVQDLPEAEKEKMTSYVAAHVRSAAEQGGHDPDLAEAMVRRDIEYKVNDTVISKSGTVLTLTSTEAEQLVGEDQHPLLSKGTVKDIDAMLEVLGLPNAKKRILEISSAEKLARLIAGIAPILMMIGLGGLWLEFKTPGFGIFGIAGITCLLLFFFGHHIAGLAGMEDILLFIIGIAFLAIEIFVTPGFGLMGISGLLLIFFSLINAMVEHVPGKWRPISFSPETFSVPLLKVTLSFCGALALVFAAGKFLPKTKIFQSLTLDSVLPDPAEDGDLLGLEGLAHSDLRPGGTAYFNDRKIDVVTYGDYIRRETPIRVVEVHGNRIVVEDISRG
ncbi:MAG: serine protease [Verrucomicrobia bacterium]|nr:MAG: serine protease [Verrucomicrobiota bacterium]